MAYEIYISDFNKTKILQFPIVPKEFPSISNDSKNEEFETYWNGTFNFIEKEGLLQFTLDSWLPTDASKYYFCKSKVNAMEIINLINQAKRNTEPIFIIMNGKEGFYVNDTFSVEKFEYNIIKRGDYKYTLGLKQWRNYNPIVTTTNSTTVGWVEDSTGWYYYYDTNGGYYADTWQLINNEWYSFDSQGYARKTVWLQDGGNYYWLKEDCKMARNEWLYYNYTWYYFGSDGSMYYGTTYTIDGVNYSFDNNGAWIES